MFPAMIGHDIQNADGQTHLGITQQTIPVLSATKEQIKAIRDNLLGCMESGIIVINFSKVAQKCLDYENYARLISTCHPRSYTIWASVSTTR
jgi:hypothetical protein